MFIIIEDYECAVKIEKYGASGNSVRNGKVVQRMSKKVTIELTEEQVREFLEIYELWLIQTIREDTDIDNIRWVRLQLDTYDTFARAIGEEDTRGTENDKARSDWMVGTNQRHIHPWWR